MSPQRLPVLKLTKRLKVEENSDISRTVRRSQILTPLWGGEREGVSTFRYRTFLKKFFFELIGVDYFIYPCRAREAVFENHLPSKIV